MKSSQYFGAKTGVDIAIDDYKEDSDGTIVINRFTFLAFSIEPCFDGATLAVFPKSEFRKQYERKEDK